MKTSFLLLALSSISLVTWMSNDSYNPVPSSPLQKVTKSSQFIQKGLPPAGMPAQFKIRFQTTAGETIDTVADYQMDIIQPEPCSIWRTPMVRYTVDHRGLDTPWEGQLPIPPWFQVSGPRRIEWTIDLIYARKLNEWNLILGNPRAIIDSRPVVQRSPTDFNLPFGSFQSESIRFFNVQVSP